MSKKSSVVFLKIITLIGLFLLPFAIGKRSFKDWVIVYLVSFIGNSFADRYLVSRGYLKYKIRPFPQNFAIHLPFICHSILCIIPYFYFITIN
ncbi:hypothetical protein [Metabacillus litoralis]|uniref:hypothetical protein n=1 Tax=Metabacillus litoralis TaxID=152268 RepID=UPI001CFD0FCC|nr:hypothetical protein [Metabacillus litoralis]